MTGNSAGERGGGIYSFYEGESTLEDNSSVTGNTAGIEGADIFNEPDPFARTTRDTDLTRHGRDGDRQRAGRLGG